MKQTNPITRAADRELIGLTSLNQAEYEGLLAGFNQLVTKKIRHYTLKGSRRKVLAPKEPKNTSLFGSRKKLDFILMYLKENPNQAYHAQVFGITQSKVSEWPSFLSPVLEESLHRPGHMPLRGYKVQLTDSLSTDYLLVDVTERPVGRREDNDGQQEEYGGKKKFHTVKNLAISDAKGNLLYLGPTFEGAVHDKAIWDGLEVGECPPNLLADLGFLGMDKGYPNAVLPFKKPRNGELSGLQKKINKGIGKCRVGIEHAFAGIKRLKVIRNKIRLKTYEVRDRVMAIATALHNFRMVMRNHS